MTFAQNEPERDALRIAGAPLGLQRGWHDVADAHLALYEEVSACPWP